MQLDNQKEIQINGSKLRVTIILPYFNETIGLELLQNAQDELLKNAVKVENIEIVRVAGALEIPFACEKVILKKNTDVIIALGVIIRGETSHYNHVCDNTYQGLMQIQLATGIPITFGILTCENEQQAKIRANSQGQNKGKQAAQAALIQANL